MKAVTRCLALFAATLVVGACSGDPTADDAGANLTIRATPNAVWMANDVSVPVNTAELIVEAVDALGGTAPGTWTAAASGPFTVAEDVTYGGTTSGQLGYRRRFVITPTGAGEGTITLTGTGAPSGGLAIPVRVAPDSTFFDVTVSNLNPALAEQITVTAPAGTRFTNTTTVSVVRGALNALNNGLAAPTLVSMTADSTQLTILPAPGAAGRIRMTGIASVSTPTLKSNAVSDDSVTVPVLASVAATLTTATPTPNTANTVTMPANFKFRPTSALTMTGTLTAPIILSRAADSNAVTILTPPGSNSPLSITAVQFAPLASLSLALPTAATVTTSAATSMGPDDYLVDGAGAVPQITAPTVVGQTVGFFDLTSFAGADNTGNGGIGTEQDYRISFPVNGVYAFSLQWGTGADLDMYLVDEAFTTAFIASFNNAGIAEAGNYTATAGQVRALAINMFGGAIPGYIRVTITRTS
jgi:hypothetical protein